MKKILIPVDYTERSRQNANLGVYLSNKMDAGIILLYSVENAHNKGKTHQVHNINEDRDLAEREKKRAEDHFTKLVKQLGPSFQNGHEPEFQFREGNLASNVLWAAREAEPALILYPHESRNVFDKILGEDIEEIVYSVDVPVWLTSAGVSTEPIRRIAYVTDYQEGSFRVLSEIVEFARILDASVYVFHVKGENKFQSSLLMEGYKKKARELKSGVKMTHIQVNSSNLVNSVEHLLQKYGINLLAFMNERENILQRWFFRSHAEKLMEKVHIPKLIFQE